MHRYNYSYTYHGRTANRMYAIFNRRWFANKLPTIPVRWPRNHRLLKDNRAVTSGTRTMPKVIRICPSYKDCPNDWCALLLHEMVHVEQWYFPDTAAHGPRFHARMRELAAKGAFEPFW